MKFTAVAVAVAVAVAAVAAVPIIRAVVSSPLTKVALVRVFSRGFFERRSASQLYLTYLSVNGGVKLRHSGGVKIHHGRLVSLST